MLQDVTRGIDTSLTLKLQKRLTELEQEKQSLRNELENKDEQYQRARARVLACTPKCPCIGVYTVLYFCNAFIHSTDIVLYIQAWGCCCLFWTR